MGRKPCCDKVGLKKGPWTAEEDKRLVDFVFANGHCCWRAVPKLAGLLRCGKSCRLRWTNYLRPDLKRGLLSEYEEQMVIDLHAQLGNRWSKIASHLTGRTDNEIKNHWNTHIKKKLTKLGIDPVTHKPISNGEEGRHEEQRSTSNAMTLPSIIAQPKVEDIIITKTVGAFDGASQNGNAFCIEDVPLLQPHEMLASCVPSSSTSTSSFASSAINGFQDHLQVLDLEWSKCDAELWDQILDGWDSMVTDGEWDAQRGIESDPSPPPPPPPLGQSPRMVLDQESWSCGLL